MHEHKVYIYVVDQDYIPTQQQKDKAELFFEVIVPEAEHAPHGWDNAQITLEDGVVIRSPFALTAGFLLGSNKYWLLDEDENVEEADEDDYDELPYGTELRPETMQELERILGTKLALVWEYDD
ncbi:hypothetical protein QSV37_02115 [Acinetobacter sp. VNK23]|uniref:hypothetical protein n=1 Tax=Acinetobacter thutiue TaxID=2998078 RepID=UPI00257601DB|nr:hypothetical protein [Acinetobacter thutiue]MDM1019111.1 hypothetical protein [Acinetobacter thutiue]